MGIHINKGESQNKLKKIDVGKNKRVAETAHSKSAILPSCRTVGRKDAKWAKFEKLVLDLGRFAAFDGLFLAIGFKRLMVVLYRFWSVCIFMDWYNTVSYGSPQGLLLGPRFLFLFLSTIYPSQLARENYTSTQTILLYFVGQTVHSVGIGF